MGWGGRVGKGRWGGRGRRMARHRGSAVVPYIRLKHMQNRPPPPQTRKGFLPEPKPRRCAWPRWHREMPGVLPGVLRRARRALCQPDPRYKCIC